MKAFSILLLGLAGLVTTRSADWPHWRGPAYNGSTPEMALPIQFSKTEGVAWVADMPGPGAATPIIWKDRVFVASVDASSARLVGLCLDRKTGKVLWAREISEGIQQDNRSNFASPSPVTDGERVIFFFGNGALAALDLQGELLWKRDIQKEEGPFAFLWTFSSSPLLYQGVLYLQVLQRDVPVNGRGRSDRPNESYLLGLDPKTGANLWKTPRPSVAVAESRESFASPIPWEWAGRREILVAGGDGITGHDPATGRELWRWESWNPQKISHWRLVPSPVAGAGVVLASAPKGAPIYAVPGGLSGPLKNSDLAWTSEGHREVSSDVPTPLFYQGDFFVLNDLRRQLSRVDPKSGAPRWTVTLPGTAKYEASPTGGAGHLYVQNFKGEVVVVNAEKGTVVHQAAFGEPGEDLVRSSIPAAHGQLFVRTNKKLYCLGSP